MPEIPPPDAAIFDFDGVIIDSRQPVRTAINDALAAHGLPRRPPAELDRFLGPPTLVAFAELTGEQPDSALLARCADTYHRRYQELYLEQTRLVDGVDGLLGRLGLPLALATSKPLAFVDPLLEKLGLHDTFEVVTAPAMSALDEPKTATVRRAMDGLGAAHPVMVGDRSFDIEAAHANGLPAIGVTRGIGARDELESAGAEAIVERPAQLWDLLEPGGA
jgi:phosphoglycolate phosphatase